MITQRFSHFVGLNFIHGQVSYGRIGDCISGYLTRRQNDAKIELSRAGLKPLFGSFLKSQLEQTIEWQVDNVMAKVRCVVFDLFGTLVHYNASRVDQNYPETYDYVHALIERTGCESIPDYPQFLKVTDRTFSQLDSWSAEHQCEFSMLTFAKVLFENLSLPQQDESVLTRFADLYTSEWSMPVQLIEGVLPLLSRCNKRFGTGLITNTHHEPMVDKVLERFGLKTFDVITTSIGHGRPKPHSSIFIDTLRKLNCDPKDSVYVGDNFNADYLGATGSGMQCYLIGKHARVPREFQIPTVLDLPTHLF